jgi:hypothetical protein
MVKVPKEFLVEGLEASGYSKPNNSCEAVNYTTPNGATFSLAKDFMGIQFCKGGRFWPPPFVSFPSMEVAVTCLRSQTKSAVDFFDETKIKLEKERREHTRESGTI